MSDLPPGWEWATLGELVDVLDHQRVPVSAREREKRKGNVPYYGATGQVGWIDQKLFDEDLVLLGEDGVQFFDGSKSKAYAVSGASWVNNHAHVMRGRFGVEQRYILHYLNRFDYRGYATGTTRLKLTQARMNAIPVPVPPIAEQWRIVAALEDHLSRLDAGLRYLQRSEATATRLIQWIYDAAACGSLLSGLRPQPGELSPGWTWKRPDDVTAGQRSDITIGPFGSNLRVSDYRDSGVPLVFVRNIRTSRFDGADTKFVSAIKASELNAHYAKPGDILITKMGDPPGDACVYNGSSQAIITADCIRLRPSVEFRPDYLSLAINSRLVRAQMECITRGVAQKKVSLQRFRQEVKLPVPSKVDQDLVMEIVKDLVDQINRTRKGSLIAQRDAAQLRRFLLAEAFAGRLVPQDPNDEPASVLLECIRAERVGQPKPRRTRRTEEADSTQEALS